VKTECKRGQVLVMVALALLALLAVVALAVDIGNVYQKRRDMQNAADAGALAGAWEICFGETGTEAAAIATAEDYAINRNGADGAVVTVSTPVTVTVLATKTVETYFAGIIGFDEIHVDADATAICGKAAAAGGIWPVAFDVRRWDFAEDNHQIDCGKTVVIWEGGRATCDTHDCCNVLTKQGEPISGVTILCEGGQPQSYPLDNQAWVDFSVGISGADPCDSGGCGAAEAIYRIEGEDNKGAVCESFIEFPDCFANPAGEKAAAWKAAENAAGRIVTIPLYDPCKSGIVGGELTEPDPDACPENAQVCTMTTSPGDNCTNERYWIDQLACIQVGVEVDGEWTSIGYFFEKPDEDGKTAGLDKARVIIATIPCDADRNPPKECGTSPGWSTGEPADPGDIKAVSLIE